MKSEKDIYVGDYLFLTVPLAAHGISFSKFAHVPKERLDWWIDSFGGSEYDYIDLPPGQYEIIGKADTLTEEQWKGIVDSPIAEYEDGEKLYLHYNHSQNEWPYIFETATESGLSFLKSKNLNPSTTLILKKKSHE